MMTHQLVLQSKMQLLGCDSNKVHESVMIKKPQHFSVSLNHYPMETSPLKRTYNEEDVDILCVNCMKMIHSSLATEHSLHCTQIISEVALIEECPIIQQADYKIRKLKDSISKLSKDSSLLQHKQNNLYYIQLLNSHADDILNIREYTKADILKCREILCNLNSLSLQFNGSPCLLVYLERLTVTSKEKYSQLINYYKEITKDTEPEAEKSKGELTEMAKKKMVTLRKSIENVEEMRGSNSIVERKTQEFSPSIVIINAQNPMDDIVSDGGFAE